MFKAILRTIAASLSSVSSPPPPEQPSSGASPRRAAVGEGSHPTVKPRPKGGNAPPRSGRLPARPVGGASDAAKPAPLAQEKRVDGGHPDDVLHVRLPQGALQLPPLSEPPRLQVIGPSGEPPGEADPRASPPGTLPIPIAAAPPTSEGSSTQATTSEDATSWGSAGSSSSNGNPFHYDEHAKASRDDEHAKASPHDDDSDVIGIRHDAFLQLIGQGADRRGLAGRGLAGRDLDLLRPPGPRDERSD